jgi:gliding motility-associated-like protein
MLRQPYYRQTLLCLLLALLSHRGKGQTASFTMPASVCTNVPVTITNTSTGGSTFYWSFCSADLLQTPVAVNMGNLTTPPQEPVFIELVEENNNYYGLMTIHYPGNLARLDFGNSLLNTPTITDLGNFGGIIYPGYGTEGIQVEKINGNWTAIIVGGSATDNDDPHIMKVDFGPSITNPSPVATDWGNVGNTLHLPIQLYLFQESGLWHGFTVNEEGNTLTRFDFGADFTNPPTAVNLGNPGGLLDGPCGVTAINDGTNWHLFLSNGNLNPPNPVVRLDFGPSLLNPFTVTGLGSFGNVIAGARTLSFLRDCDQMVGYLTDGQNRTLVQLDFHNDVLSVPTATNLGNLGGWTFPHSLSQLFRVGADLYSFVPDAFASTITRLRFPGCTNASIPSSTAAAPPPVSWTQPGTYRVNLIMDEGLITQTSYCQTIAVEATPSFSLGDDTTLCAGDTLVLRYNGATVPPTSFLWQDGSSLDTFAVSGTGQYSLKASTNAGCSTTSSVRIGYLALPAISTLPDTSICFGSPLQLTTRVSSADSVQWTPATGLSSTSAVSPDANPGATVSYIVTAWDVQCSSRDTVQVTVLQNPVVSITADTLICVGASSQLLATGAATYSWYPAPGLSDTGIADPQATPAFSQIYYVKGNGTDHCVSLDSVWIHVKAPDVFAVSARPAAICPGDSSVLTAAGAYVPGGDGYVWQSPAGLPDPGASSVSVSPPDFTTYEVVGIDKVCNRTDTLKVDVSVLPTPNVNVAKSNDIGCIYGEATLTATGDGIRYQWAPAPTLSDPYSAAPVARTDTTTRYWVTATGSDGCSAIDSITVFVTKAGGNIGFPVANAFTPNGDGANDRFGIKYWGYIGEFQMVVYNRWGQTVFSTANPDEQWDGSFKGQLLPAGTYVYMIRANTLCGVAFKKGTVELIR